MARAARRAVAQKKASLRVAPIAAVIRVTHDAAMVLSVQRNYY